MELARATNRTVRLRNRSALLSRLFLDGPLTRQHLMRGTGLSQPAVSNVVADLIAEGLVAEAGAAESDGGRPGMMLRVAPRYAFVVGVDVGETRIRVELFDFAMTLLSSVEYPLDPARTEPSAVAGHVLAGIDTVTARARVAPADVLGVGIGVSGVVEQGAEAVVHARPWAGVGCRWSGSSAPAPTCRCTSTTARTPSARPRCGSVPAGARGTPCSPWSGPAWGRPW